MVSESFYFLKELPDLTLGKYQAQDASNVGDLLNKQKHFIRQWHSICGLLGLSLHFLMSVDKKCPKGAQLDICMVLRGEDVSLRKAEILLFNSSLSEYYIFEKSPEKESRLRGQFFGGAAALSKGERASVSLDETRYTFVPNWEMNDKCRLLDAVNVMESLGGDAVFRVDVYPVNLVEQTRKNFDMPINNLKNPKPDKDKGAFSLTQRDYGTQDALKQYEEWLKKIETTPHFRVNIYSFAEDEVSAKLILRSAASEALEEGECRLCGKEEILRDAESFSALWGLDSDKPCEAKAYFSETFSKKFKDWTTTYTLDELAVFLRFPALYEGETIELRKETAANPLIDGLLLANDKNGHDVRFPIEHFEKHAFICGVPGSGKTNTMLHLTSSLWKKYQIPFLVFEPAKKEYRALFNDPFMRDALLLFSPSAGTKLPLMLNPFEFPKGLTLSEHIAALSDVFKGTFKVEGSVFVYLDRAIERSYTELGWLYDDVNDGTLPYPTLGDIKTNYEKEAAETKYVGENKGFVEEFLKVRLSGLMVREIGELFNVKQSTLKPEEWLKKPILIEMEALSENARNFLILTLCTLIRETLKCDALSGEYNSLRHVIFIEEAHNLIAPNTQQASSESDPNPKVSATAYIVKMLAEVRALHEGIVIADQLPSAIAPEVMKNTGLKIVHRMTAKDDRDMVGSTMAATEAQLERLVTYSQGDALLFYEGLQLPFYAKTCYWENGAYEGKPLTSSEIFNALSEDNAKILGNSLLRLLDGIYTDFEKTSSDCILKIHSLEKVSPNNYPALKSETESMVSYCRELGLAFVRNSRGINRRFPELNTKLTDARLHNIIESRILDLDDLFKDTAKLTELNMRSQNYEV